VVRSIQLLKEGKGSIISRNDQLRIGGGEKSPAKQQLKERRTYPSLYWGLRKRGTKTANLLPPYKKERFGPRKDVRLGQGKIWKGQWGRRKSQSTSLGHSRRLPDVTTGQRFARTAGSSNLSNWGCRANEYIRVGEENKQLLTEDLGEERQETGSGKKGFSSEKDR